MKHAEKQSDSALQRALKDDAATNAELTSLAKGNDHLMAKIHQISSRLADPHERSERVRQRKEARMRQRIERQSLKQQQLIAFWTRKFANHITSQHIDDEAARREDETLKTIESKLIKLGVDTDGLFRDRSTLCLDDPDDEEQQLLDLQNLPDAVPPEPDDDVLVHHKVALQRVSSWHQTTIHRVQNGKDCKFRESKSWSITIHRVQSR